MEKVHDDTREPYVYMIPAMTMIERLRFFLSATFIRIW